MDIPTFRYCILVRDHIFVLFCGAGGYFLEEVNFHLIWDFFLFLQIVPLESE